MTAFIPQSWRTMEKWKELLSEVCVCQQRNHEQPCEWVDMDEKPHMRMGCGPMYRLFVETES